MIFGLLRACSLRGLESTYNRVVAQFAEGPRKDLTIIQTLLEHCPNEWAVRSAILSRAINFKDVKLVKMLLPRAKVNEGTRVTLPLNQAIHLGNAATIEVVLDASGDVNFTNYTNEKNESRIHLAQKCPLDWAIRRNLEVVRLLLDRGAIVPPVERWFWVEATTYEALRSARIAQTGEVVPTYKETREIMHREQLSKLHLLWDVGCPRNPRSAGCSPRECALWCSNGRSVFAREYDRLFVCSEQGKWPLGVFTLGTSSDNASKLKSQKSFKMRIESDLLRYRNEGEMRF
jgi:hypothetical protein